MKKILFALIVVMAISLSVFALGEENTNWDKQPVITVAYEMSAEKLYLEWEGNSLLYQIQMDGKRILDVGEAKAIISIKKGTHTIIIYPTYSNKADNNIVSANIDGVGTFGLDLSSLGIGGQDLSFGNASEPLNIDYNPNPILNAVPDKLSADTVEKNDVRLSFVDRYNADAYLITVKSGNDLNYVQFNSMEDSASFISKERSISSVLLDQDYLTDNNCMIPELDEKYSFQVQLRKYAVNLVNGEKIKTVMLESKASKWFDYTPIAGWKSKPAISFASQVADGQVKIAWEHNSFGIDVDYSVIKSNKALFVKTGEEVLGITKEHEMIINDLTNGDYTLSVVPKYDGETGPGSDEVTIAVKNEWVIAPNLVCEQAGDHQIKLSWTAAENIEQYHIKVLAGDSNSLLRFVDMDYKMVSEVNVDAIAGPMEYTYTYDGSADKDTPIRLKFEIYGIRHTEAGKEQTSAVSSATIIAE